MDFYRRAYELKDEIVTNRRHLHQMPEVGFDLPRTTAFVKEKLIEMGYQPEEIIENGLTATVGKGGKTFLLRADMDALPMEEKTGLPYAATNGNCHSCGHDSHTAGLLAAAKMLKEVEGELKGTVKLMFQPAEELLTGAEKMVQAGILENPKVDAALMCHTNSTYRKGIALVRGPKCASSNNFRVTVQGSGGHGAMPEKGVDPVLIGCHIVLALQELITREIAFPKGAVLTTGGFQGGRAFNIIPDTAVIEGTFRTFTTETQEHIKKRVPEVCKGIAETFRGTAEVTYHCDVPVLINELPFINKMEEYITELSDGRFEIFEEIPSTGSEDFAFITREVPGAMLMLGAKNPDGPAGALHNPTTLFDEDAFPIAAATLAHCAVRWLEDNQ